MNATIEQVENRHKVPKALWKKFSEKQRVVYNNMRSHKMNIMVHFDTKISPKEWDTISHNFACMAAWEF
jgi:hypothetical protein